MDIETISGLVVIIGYPLAIVFETKHTLWEKIIAIASGEVVFVLGCNLLSLNLEWPVRAGGLLLGAGGIVFLHVRRRSKNK